MHEHVIPDVVSIAWYEEADYLTLAARHPAATDLAERYSDWRRKATGGVFALLQSGKAVDLVTVRAEEYSAWLGPEPDTQAARRHYLAQCSVGAVRVDRSVVLPPSGARLS